MSQEPPRLVYRHDGHVYDPETDECLVCGVHYTRASFDPCFHRLLCDLAKEEARQDAFHPVRRRLAQASGNRRGGL